MLPRAVPPPRRPRKSHEPQAPKWKQLFKGGSRREVLERIYRGDPLGLEARSLKRIAERALLVDLDRVVECALANVAFFAPRYHGLPSLDRWLTLRIDAGIGRVLDDELEADRTLTAFDPPTQLHDRMARALGLDRFLARRACVVFNSLPWKVRRVFQAVVMDQRPLESLPAEEFGPAASAERRLRAALLTISQLRPAPVLPEDGGLDEE